MCGLFSSLHVNKQWKLTKHSLCGAFRHVPTQGWSAALCVTAYHIMKLFLFFFLPLSLPRFHTAMTAAADGASLS